MPINKIYDMVLIAVPDTMVPQFESKILHLLSPEEAAKHENWLLQFFGKPQSVPMHIDAETKTITASHAKAMQLHKQTLREGYLHEPVRNHPLADLWLGKQQWEQPKEEKHEHKCNCCGHEHIRLPRTSKRQQITARPAGNQSSSLQVAT
mgnify:CR=1 FL=1